jgi:imidazolonepropionase-like amidohydrolase
MRSSIRAIGFFVMWASGPSLFGPTASEWENGDFGASVDGTRFTGKANLALVGGRLIDGYGGAPLENSVILIDGNKIAAIGQVGQLEVPEGAKILDTNGMTVMPGLWESHAHLFHAGEGKPTKFQPKFVDRAREIMAAAARTNLMAGITTLRDVGVPSQVVDVQLRLREDIEAGREIGPRLYVSGPLLHQSTRSLPAGMGQYSVTTSDEARSAVERLVSMGVDQIKVNGFWDEPILRAVADSAHRAGLGVDADVRHMEAYRTAVKAGVDRLHHVFTADPLSDYSKEDLRLLVRGEKPSMLGPSANILRGPYMVPTMEMRQAYVRGLNYPEIIDHPKFKEQYPPEIYEYLHQTWKDLQSIPWGIGARERMKVVKQKVRRFIEAGGREQLVAGCDAGSPLNFHSALAREVATLAEVGLTSMEAIQAATLRAAQMQGVDDQLGTVSVGKLADIIVVDGDPLQDIRVLQHGIVHVIKDGKVYK